MSYILFGGLFDPPHKGHLEIARSALRAVSPDVLYWIPSRYPPHRGSGVLSGKDRYNILKQWLSSFDTMAASDIELDPEHSGYTIETIEKFKKKKKGQKCFLLIGSDEAENFYEWKDWRKILQMTSLLVGRRNKTIDIPEQINAKILDNKIINISSSELRDKLFRDRSVEDDIMSCVLNIIKEKKFYRR